MKPNTTLERPLAPIWNAAAACSGTRKLCLVYWPGPSRDEQQEGMDYRVSRRHGLRVV